MKLKSFLILSLSIFILASCGNKEATTGGLVIPEDASMVIHVNGASLSSKISWEEINQSKWFKEASKHSEDTSAHKFFSNPASSGINTKTDIFVYTKKQGAGSYLIVAGSIADANAFESFCKTFDKEESKEVKKEKGFSYMTSDHGAVVWNSTHFAIAANSFMEGGVGAMRRFKDRNNDDYEPKSWKHEFLPDSLKIFGMEALSGKSSDNLESDKRFSALIKDGNDLHFWLNSGNLYSGMAGMIPFDTKALFEGNVGTFSVNFDNGKVTAKIKQYFGEKMSKLVSKGKAEPVTAAVINRIPSSNVAAVIAVNYSPDVIKEFLKLIGADMVADMVLAKMDFSLDDFIKANKGQVLIALSPGETTEAQAMVKKSKGGDEVTVFKKDKMKVLFATAVNDKAAFEKMVTLIWDAAKKMKGGGTEAGDKPFPFSFRLEGDWFAASNSAELTDKFLAGGDNKHPFTDKITGHPFAVYVDLQKLIKSTKHTEKADSASLTAMNMWQDIVATGGEYKDEAMQFDFAVNMTDKNTNSLKQLNSFFDHMMAKSKFDIKEVTIEDIKQEGSKMEPPPPPPPQAPKKKSKK